MREAVQAECIFRILMKKKLREKAKKENEGTTRRLYCTVTDGSFIPSIDKANR